MGTADVAVVSRVEFERERLMNGSAEDVFDLVRGSKGVKERRRAQRGCALPAGSKGFRCGDGVARARIVRMGRLEDRQHPSGTCRGVERDLSQLVLFEMHAVSYHVTGFPI